MNDHHHGHHDRRLTEEDKTMRSYRRALAFSEVSQLLFRSRSCVWSCLRARRRITRFTVMLLPAVFKSISLLSGACNSWYFFTDIGQIYDWYKTESGWKWMWLKYDKYMTDADADAVTPSSNTRSYTLRSVPSSPEQSFWLLYSVWWNQSKMAFSEVRENTYLYKNIATRKTSPAITPYHFFGNSFNFHH